MSHIQKYKPEFIFKFQNNVKLTKSVENVFLQILQNMGSATDSKNFKVKVSKDIKLNSNKWHRKRFLTDVEKIKKAINSNLNMYSKSTFKKVSLDIMKIKINSEELIDYLINCIIYKYTYDYQSDVWNYLIEIIIFNNVEKWKINNKFLVHRLLDKVQYDFNKIVDSDYQETLEVYFDSNIEEYYRIKRKNNGLMKFIAELFKYNLINKELITSILEYLILDINKYYKMELGVYLVTYLFNFISSIEQNKFIDYFNIFLKDKNLNKKVKFMILDFIDEKNISTVKKPENIKTNISNYLNDEQIELYIKNIINDYLNDEENLEDSTKLIANLKISPKSNKIIYYWILFLLENKDNQDKIMILFCNCFQNKIIKYNTLKYGLIEFLVDYNNFKWDYPNINNVLKMFIKICKMKLFLTSDNINYIFSKSSCDEKENIL